MDVTEMTFADEFFDSVIDKGTLDAIIVFYSLICFSFDFFRSKPIF
jgi:hypothetical protein